MPTQPTPAIETFGLQEYFIRTESAVRPQFTLLHTFNEETRAPPIRTDETGLVINSREEMTEYVERVQRNRNHHFSKAVVCGTILQVAYVAIKQYSRNQIESGEFEEFGVTPNSNAAKFCIGRLVHGIPLGLLVFAGRNQFNHWEDGDPTNPVTNAVFDKLYLHHWNNPLADLVYLLDWPWFRPVTHFVMWDEMGWRSFEIYLDDMRGMLPETPDDAGTARE